MFNYEVEETTTYRSLLDADVREFDSTMEDSYRYQQWLFDHPKIAEIQFWLQQKIGWLMEHTICKWFGCKIEMEGHADGDSGYEDWWCTHCGRGGHHIYY
jgi:hypothetical protein